MSKQANYKGIVFEPGYNKTFAEFKKEFGMTHIFKNMHPDVREDELKVAYKIAKDGHTSPTITEGESTKE